MNNIGLALGGGGVRGMAHLLALEELDKLSIRPAAIAGTSMGALVGAVYASGLTGKEIRSGVERHIIRKDDQLKDILQKKSDLFKWLTFAKPTLKRGGFLSANGIIGYLMKQIEATTFEELEIPLSIVATDFWSGEQVIFDSGELLPALTASMAIPGIFAPVEFEDRVLVDGGLVNNLPYDILAKTCDYTIAIDVAPTRKPNSDRPVPNILDAALGMFDLMLEKAVEQKMELSPPNLYFRPELVGIRTLDFDEIETVFEQAAPNMNRFKEQLISQFH